MIGNAAWLALAVAALALEGACRASHGRWPTLGAVGSALWQRPLGRAALIALWAFVGVHVFARSTVPR